MTLGAIFIAGTKKATSQRIGRRVLQAKGWLHLRKKSLSSRLWEEEK
jgi:hypothetical protein